MFVGPFAFFLLFLFFGLQHPLIGPDWLGDDPLPLLDYVFAEIIGLVVFPEIAGVAIAKRKRGELAGAPFESHAISAIRTSWIALAGFVIAFLLPILVFGRLGENTHRLARVFCSL